MIERTVEHGMPYHLDFARSLLDMPKLGTLSVAKTDALESIVCWDTTSMQMVDHFSCKTGFASYVNVWSRYSDFPADG